MSTTQEQEYLCGKSFHLEGKNHISTPNLSIIINAIQYFKFMAKIFVYKKNNNIASIETSL